jgi:GR25 family glycosyltransferase involved in LPS biosynthesis
MINCRIICVDVDDKETEKAVNTFCGLVLDDQGKNQRYIVRRRKVEEFIHNTKIPGINFEIFNAVTPKDYIIKDGRIIIDNKSLLLNEVSPLYQSCGLSHYRLWNLEEDTLILEDDAVLKEDLFKDLVILIEKFQKLEDKSKVLYLQKSCPWDGGQPKKFKLFDTPISEIKQPPKNSDFAGTVAYFIPLSAKKRILHNFLPFKGSDGFLHDCYRYNIITYYVPANINLMIEVDKETMTL